MLFSPFRHFNGKVTIHLIVQRPHFWLRIHMRNASHMEHHMIFRKIRLFSDLIHCIDCVHLKSSGDFISHCSMFVPTKLLAPVINFFHIQILNLCIIFMNHNSQKENLRWILLYHKPLIVIGYLLLDLLFHNYHFFISI